MMAWQSLMTTRQNSCYEPSALARNFTFFGNAHGGEREALLYGLSCTCRLNGIDPETYLRHILSVLPKWPSNKGLNFCPGMWISPINSRQYGTR